MAKLFSDVNIIETTVITPEGRIEKVFRVSARSKSGVAFSLDILEAEFTMPKVEAALTEKATLIEKIKEL